MPMDKARYPDNWKAITSDIKNSSDWCCEECGKPCRREKEPWEEFYQRLPTEWRSLVEEGGRVKKQRFTLTVAHLDHQPENCELSNLRAWCSVCHLRYDQQHHLSNAMKTRQAKNLRINHIQLELL